MNSTDAFLSRLRARVTEIAYTSPFYRLTLSGQEAAKLPELPADPWPGNAAAGLSITQGIFAYGGQSFAADPPLWQPAGAETAWLSSVHGFAWLRDLRALGGDTARRRARTLLDAWFKDNGQWSAALWTPDWLGSRIAHLISLYDFYGASADDPFRARLLAAIAQQTRHLSRILPAPLSSESNPASLAAIKGLLYGSLALQDGEKSFTQAMALLLEALPRLLHADGGSRARTPSLLLSTARSLIDIRCLLRAADLPLPAELSRALDTAIPALRLLRHGDGGLALFHGGREEDTVEIEAVLNLAEARSRTAKRLIDTGYERLQAGRALVLLDAGLPPPKGFDDTAHASSLAFEFSVGRERLIVNCGAPPRAHPEWRKALAATAAHSALTLADKNSAEILPKGGIGRRPQSLTLERLERDGDTIVAGTQDGYLANLGTLHRRSLTLAAAGDSLTGEDMIESQTPHAFAIRFHLHPLVNVSLIQQDTAALLRLPSGQGWRLKSENLPLVIEDSLYAGQGEPRRTRQLVIHGQTQKGRTTLSWHLQKEGKV